MIKIHRSDGQIFWRSKWFESKAERENGFNPQKWGADVLNLERSGGQMIWIHGSESEEWYESKQWGTHDTNRQYIISFKGQMLCRILESIAWQNLFISLFDWVLRHIDTV
jgi:hypothetical protein